MKLESNLRRTRVSVLTVLLILALAASVAAGPLQMGVKAGLSRASQTFEYSNFLGDMERDSRSGLAFGFFVDIPFTPIVALRLDALYVQKGSQLDVIVRTYGRGVDATETRTLKDRLDYLSLSLTGKANVWLGLANLYLIAGPRLDIKISEDFEDRKPFAVSPYRSTVKGLVLGGGVETSLIPSATVLLEARYDLDLDDAGDQQGDDIDLTIKSKGFLILAGLRF